MATETDAARDRVLATRAALGEELETLEASARAAVDIPARIRKSPTKAAAVVGGTGFLVLGGPRRVLRGVKRVVRGPQAPMPKSMLPDEIEKALRGLGSDGDRVRGAIERDFAAYARQAGRDRARVRTLLMLSVARPLLFGGAKAAAGWLFKADDEGFQARLAQVRDRATRMAGGGGSAPAAGGAGRAAPATAATAAGDESDDEAGAAGA